MISAGFYQSWRGSGGQGVRRRKFGQDRSAMDDTVLARKPWRFAGYRLRRRLTVARCCWLPTERLTATLHDDECSSPELHDAEEVQDHENARGNTQEPENKISHCSNLLAYIGHFTLLKRTDYWKNPLHLVPLSIAAGGSPSPKPCVIRIDLYFRFYMSDRNRSPLNSSHACGVLLTSDELDGHVILSSKLSIKIEDSTR